MHIVDVKCSPGENKILVPDANKLSKRDKKCLDKQYSDLRSFSDIYDNDIGLIHIWASMMSFIGLCFAVPAFIYYMITFDEPTAITWSTIGLIAAALHPAWVFLSVRKQHACEKSLQRVLSSGNVKVIPGTHYYSGIAHKNGFCFDELVRACAERDIDLAKVFATQDTVATSALRRRYTVSVLSDEAQAAAYCVSDYMSNVSVIDKMLNSAPSKADEEFEAAIADAKREVRVHAVATADAIVKALAGQYTQKTTSIRAATDYLKDLREASQDAPTP